MSKSYLEIKTGDLVLECACVIDGYGRPGCPDCNGSGRVDGETFFWQGIEKDIADAKEQAI